MAKWSEFGDQVNRLVYTLAGRKFHTDIEVANRFIAERIYYSEVSVRMMRQGRFRPQQVKALETLVEIGQSEAELSREWASRLLHSGRHPNPETVLQRVYSASYDADPPPALPVPVSAFPLFPARLVGGLLGSLMTLLLWTYLLSPVYPAPHELSVLMETVWGFFTGSGLAVGTLLVDVLAEKKRLTVQKPDWLLYLLLPAAGIVGALLWHLAAGYGFSTLDDAPVVSTWFETFSFGAVYGFAFAAGTILARRSVSGVGSRLMQALFPFIFALTTGSISSLGFTLMMIQPSFANQKDIDICVSIFLRVSLALIICIFFPPIHASGDHESSLLSNPLVRILKV